MGFLSDAFIIWSGSSISFVLNELFRLRKTQKWYFMLFIFVHNIHFWIEDFFLVILPLKFFV